MCQICGIPNILPCSCVSQQSFCDQCADDTRCLQEMDSQCVIYHQNTSIPTKLRCLNMPNGSSVEAILEKIDSFVCNAFNIPFIAVDSASIDFTQSGNAGHVITADVNISAQAGNILSILADGLYVPPNDGKVKVNVSTPPRYLEDAVIGATDGCTSISVETDDSGLLVIHPTLNIDCLSALLCADPAFTLCIGNSLCSSSNFVNCIQASLCANTDFQDCVLAIVGPVSAGANNGLHIDGGSGDVYLGGTLVETTTIDQSTFQWNILSPNISIGTSAAQTQSAVYAEDLASTKSTLFNLLKQSVIVPGQNVATIESFLKLTDGAFVDPTNGAHHDSIDAQLWMNYSGNLTLNAGPTSTYAGLYGTVIIGGAGNYAGNILAGGNFRGNAAGSGNATDIAGILINGLEAAGGVFGGAYSGTVTNYYGLYIRNINGSGLNANVTNKYAIFQEAGAAINSFSTAVVITSDARTKENVVDYTKGLSDIEKVRIVEYNIIGDDKKRIGVIAQELETVIPEAVQIQDRSGQGSYSDTRVVDYNVIYSTLIKSVQELSAQNKALIDRVIALESK